MPPSNSLAAHQAYLEIWARAAQAPKGIKVNTDNPIAMRQRLYSARAAERKNNAKIFTTDNVMHGRSYYEDFIVKLAPGAVLIIPTTLSIEGVEEL